jgi:hypothetical protein
MEKKEENGVEIIRQTVSKLLNVDASVKRKAKKEFDKQRDLFLQVIQQLESLNIQSALAHTDIGIDFTKYDERFYTIIDTLLLAKYGKDLYELVSFYLWERVNPDGTINPIIGPNEELITLETPLDLWNVAIAVNPSIGE